MNKNVTFWSLDRNPKLQRVNGRLESKHVYRTLKDAVHAYTQSRRVITPRTVLHVYGFRIGRDGRPCLVDTQTIVVRMDANVGGKEKR